MIGVVADDTTGANDIGLMFGNNDYAVKVVTFGESAATGGAADVLIIDTDSRLDDPKESYRKVYEATNQLQAIGCSMYFNKTCSVFRGNIGEELDAMLDALGEEFAVISLAFPKNGRQTIQGMHYVRGILLENSEFSRDPVHPMKQSNLVDILQQQTKRKVVSIALDVVRQGPIVLRQKMEQLREHYNYCIIDAEEQSDLEIIAEAVHDLKVVCGSSAIAEELPKFMKIKRVVNPVHGLQLKDSNGVLIISGSLTPQTRAQTAYLIQQGVPSIVLDTRNLFDDSTSQSEIKRVLQQAKPLIMEGADVLVMADNSEAVVRETKALGIAKQLEPLTISKMVSAALAEIAEQLVNATGLKRIVVAGGDTSGTVSRKLGFTGNYVLKEIETGLPSGLSLGREMLIVLKSGSFGKPEFLETAVQHLKDLSY
ncbi:four-carbon acid sugar kinase family protein [Paenibacillus glycanilyticus]|uniref:four-carbon acid sugar kinase family protein n=1 Tax=Paenibacillus glycanilyticus TaxID=126569 RepID=UPI001F343C57|nr:four-carbon acid sugar kinase family protein [Paenibacillus glycanilyticus]